MSIWGKKDEDLPEELRGLSQEQIVAAVKASKELEATRTRIAQLESSGTTKEGELNILKDKVTQLETALAKAAPTAPAAPAGPKAPTSVLIDEEEAFKERLAPTQAVALHSAGMSARILARDQALRGREAKLWTKYESEIEDLMSKETPERRAFPQIWQNAFTYVKGLHLEDVLKAQKDGNDFFSEPVTSGGRQHTDDGEADTLSPEELAVAKAMKIKPEEYLASKKALEAGTGGSGVGHSS